MKVKSRKKAALWLAFVSCFMLPRLLCLHLNPFTAKRTASTSVHAWLDVMIVIERPSTRSKNGRYHQT